MDALDEVQVKTKTGVLNGYVSENGIETFLGIPYAQAPVGNLRWKAPVSLEESDKEIDVKHFGYTCPQVYDEGESTGVGT